MRYVDFNKMTFKEAGITLSSYSFYTTFKKLGINTLGQLFDDVLMQDIIKRARILTRGELRGFISLMKYQYLGIPMTSGVYLECEGIPNPNGLICNKYNFKGVDFNQMGFNAMQQSAIYECKEEYGASIVGMKLVDFFRDLVEQGYCDDKVRGIMQVYINYYDKANNLGGEMSNSEDLNRLNDELGQLLAIKGRVDEQIAILQYEIDALVSSVGGPHK